MIREAAGWKCQRCHEDFSWRKELLHCSHYITRANKATRFDSENCAALCWTCHQYLDGHPADHRAWKLQSIGLERFEALHRRALAILKIDRQALKFVMS